MKSRSEWSHVLSGRQSWIVLALVAVLVLAIVPFAYARFDQYGAGAFSLPYAPYTAGPVVGEVEPYAPYTAGPVVRELTRPYAPYTAGPVVGDETPYAPYTAGPVVDEEKPWAPHQVPR